MAHHTAIWSPLARHVLLRYTDDNIREPSKASLDRCTQELQPLLGGGSEWRAEEVKQMLQQYRAAVKALDKPPRMWADPLTGTLADGSVIAVSRPCGPPGADYTKFSIYKERPTTPMGASSSSADAFLTPEAALLSSRASFAVFRGFADHLPIDELIQWGASFVEGQAAASGIEAKGHRFGDILQDHPCDRDSGMFRFAHPSRAASASGAERHWQPFSDKAREAAVKFATWRAGWVGEGPSGYAGAQTYVAPVSRLFLREFKPKGPKKVRGLQMHHDACSLSVIVMLRPAQAHGDLLVSLSNAPDKESIAHAPVLALNLGVGDVVVMDSQCLHAVEDAAGSVSRWTLVAFFGY